MSNPTVRLAAAQVTPAFLDLNGSLRLWGGRLGRWLVCFRAPFCRGWGGGRQSLRFPHFTRIDLSLTEASEVVVHRLFVIQAEVLGVGTNESFIKDAAGKLIEVFFFDGLEHARADLGDVGNLVEREFFFLARVTKFVSEVAHVDAAGAVILATS